MNNIQYTIRNVPPVLDRALRVRASQRRKSLNDTLLEALAKGSGVGEEMHLHHDLDHFFGSWVEDSKVEKALLEQRKIDKNLWK